MHEPTAGACRERRELNAAVRGYLGAAGYKLSALTFGEEAGVAAPAGAAPGPGADAAPSLPELLRRDAERAGALAAAAAAEAERTQMAAELAAAQARAAELQARGPPGGRLSCAVGRAGVGAVEREAVRLGSVWRTSGCWHAGIETQRGAETALSARRLPLFTRGVAGRRRRTAWRGTAAGCARTASMRSASWTGWPRRCAALQSPHRQWSQARCVWRRSQRSAALSRVRCLAAIG